MILGIVGSESAKFTDATKGSAISEIYDLIQSTRATKVVSGGCHLGGIDAWAIRAAKDLGVDTHEYLPKTRSWNGGYKQRNMAIAEASDFVVCITVKELPPNYKGMRFPYCYHCKTDEHIKSGGCWTVKYAKSLGKKTEVIVIYG